MNFLIAVGMGCVVVFGGAWLWGLVTRRTIISVKAHKTWLKAKLTK